LTTRKNEAVPPANRIELYDVLQFLVSLHARAGNTSRRFSALTETNPAPSGSL
jgi:hypothetical protein